MIKNNKMGSLTLMVLGLLVLLTAIICAALRTNTYFISIAHEREKRELQYQLVRSLHEYSMAEHADELKKTEIGGKAVIFNNPWPDKKSCYNGFVWIDSKEGVMHTELKHKERMVNNLLYHF